MTLDEARQGIDGIDKELLRLLNERAHFVNVIGEIKQKEGLEIYAPEREEKLLRKLVELNQAQGGKLPEKSIRAIYREVMSAALAMEHPLRIAYLGPPGTRTHQVALNKFGHGVTYLSHSSLPTLFASLQSQDSDYAILPLEHSHEGNIYHTLDSLADTPLQVCAQITISTGNPEATASHSRFLIIGRRSSPATGDDSTLLVIEAGDRLGLLQALLQPFVRHSINVRQIENRPANGIARFFLEIQGHHSDAPITTALSDLAAEQAQARILGSYPSTVWVESIG
jgi:chorismate mutase-like protein